MNNGIWVIGIMVNPKERVFYTTDKIKSISIMKDNLMDSLTEKVELSIMTDNINIKGI